MALHLRLTRGMRVVMNDAEFAVLKDTRLKVDSNVDIWVYNPGGSLRRHFPKKDTE